MIRAKKMNKAINDKKWGTKMESLGKKTRKGRLPFGWVKGIISKIADCINNITLAGSKNTYEISLACATLSNDNSYV